MGQAMARLGEVMYAFWASLYLRFREDRSHCIDSIARYAFLDCVISSSFLSESLIITLDSGMGMTPR